MKTPIEREPRDASSDASTRRITCIVSGRVQGVGFRAQTKARAENYAVTGTVENMSDGRVRIVAEGLRHELIRFLADAETPTTGRVTDSVRFESEATGEFSGFTIRR